MLPKRPSAKINHQALQLNTRKIAGTAGFVRKISGSADIDGRVLRWEASGSSTLGDKTPSRTTPFTAFR